MCQECNRPFQRKYTLLRHLHTAHSKAFQFSCHICNCNFSLESHLIDHMRKLHGTCGYCRKSFSNRRTLYVHIAKKHRKVGLYKCDICNKSFSCKPLFYGHWLNHSSEELFQCNLCGVRFQTSTSLLLHTKQFHVNTEDRQTINHNLAQQSLKIEDKNSLCSEDNNTFPTQTKDMEMTEVESKIEVKNEGHVCSVCNKICLKKSALISHLKSHNNTFRDSKSTIKDKKHVCSVCDKVFITKAALLSHSNTHGKRIFACEFCDYVCNTKVDLVEHYRICLLK